MTMFTRRAVSASSIALLAGCATGAGAGASAPVAPAGRAAIGAFGIDLASRDMNVKPGDIKSESVTLPSGKVRQQVKLLSTDERTKLAKSKDEADKATLAADDRVRRALMHRELQRLAAREALSPDLADILSRSLAG